MHACSHHQAGWRCQRCTPTTPVQERGVESERTSPTGPETPVAKRARRNLEAQGLLPHA